MDKKKQIEEMANIVFNSKNKDDHISPLKCANELYNAGCRMRITRKRAKPPRMGRDSVILGLRCCSSKSFDCKKCPYEHYGMGKCSLQLCKDALYIIEEQNKQSEQV